MNITVSGEQIFKKMSKELNEWIKDDPEDWYPVEAISYESFVLKKAGLSQKEVSKVIGSISEEERSIFIKEIAVEVMYPLLNG